jgi:hypothetical protein
LVAEFSGEGEEGGGCGCSGWHLVRVWRVSYFADLDGVVSANLKD